MSAEGLKARYGNWLAVLQAGWQWWRGEIAALVPLSLRRQLESAVCIVTIDLEADAVILRRFAAGGVAEIARLPRADFDAAHLRAALAPQLARPWYRRDSFALRLPDTAALKRNLSLPLGARRNIASLLDIELERQSPLDRSEIYHDYRILQVDRQAGRLDIVWRIVRRKSVAPALEICRQAGIDLAVIAFSGDEAPPDGGNYPIERRAALLLLLRRWLIRGLMLLVLLLLLAATAGAYSRNRDASDAFAARVDRAREAARVSLQLEHEIAATRKRAAVLLHERQRVTVSRILAETTRLLPNGSWLDDFAYRDGEVRIRGYSNAAPSLLALFDASPLFTAAEFRAPLMQAQGPGQEQFDLSFRIREGAR